jgi:proline dehydrogenase
MRGANPKAEAAVALRRIARNESIKAYGQDNPPLYGALLRTAKHFIVRKMRNLGYQTRTCLPYGREWYLYLCHRLAEYPPNSYQAIFHAAGTKEART